MEKKTLGKIGIVILAIGFILLVVGVCYSASTVGVMPATMDWETTMNVPNPAPNQLFVVVGVIGLILLILGTVMTMYTCMPNIKITIGEDDA